MPETAAKVTGVDVQVWTDGGGLSHPQSPGWTAPRPGERKNAYGYAVPMSTLQVVLLTAAARLLRDTDYDACPEGDSNRERAAWWSICDSLERDDRTRLQRACADLYGDVPAGPWEDG